ncbi:unnamed protein product [Rotaria socialis]|uniref:Uncharacterized protein n=2 Tax=Rotaria socialis TaxID=392032 RepID=A0A820WMY3_9BILA|nr:unnamed protein product [Rotaria socialis]
MSSSDEGIKLFEKDDKNQTELLTNVQRNKYRQKRILINYKAKTFRDVLHDLKIVEKTNNLLGCFLIIKLKSSTHE